ncbi:MAG: SH3 domain-containing protein [Spirochaetota bacterium]
MTGYKNASRKDALLGCGLIVLAAVLLTGCGDNGIGAGVVLWSPDESVVRSGSVVTVLAESSISDTYRIAAEEIEEPFELERWRVEFFDAEPEAEARAADYAAAFDGNTTLYARATRNALPIREDANAVGDNTVYRLREGEEIKLIDRQPEETELGGLVSYWYETLTETGQRGWVFGYTLEVFDPTDDTVAVERGTSSDPLVDLLLQNVWRPIYYADMISNAAIDLELFCPEYGLFPDPENRQLELVLRRHATIFEYEQIVRVGSRRYLAEGTSLQLTFHRNDELSLQYLLDGRQQTLAMQRVPGEIEEYVHAELERRGALYEEVFSRGPRFRSDNYGELEFLVDQRFDWTGYERLVPIAIPQGARTTGSVDLGLFLSASLMQEYDGALSFQFDGARDPVSFAYTFRRDGIRLVWIPQANIEDRLVRRVDSSPLTVFMSSTGE